MTRTNDNLDDGRSVLASLRAMVPNRPLRFSEALRVAEWQATRLLELFRIEDGPVPAECISELPRIRVIYRDMPTSGASCWDGTAWVIYVNKTEPKTRQRFTLFHEYKHIVDHGRTTQLYGGSSDARAEQVADFFAGCALMPRRFLKRAWGHGVQDPARLARAFDVSPRAASVRLAQIGLSDPMPRCDVVSPATSFGRSPRRYFRQRSIHTPPQAPGLSAPEVVNV